MAAFDIGITFSPGQGRLLEGVVDLLDLIEIEPQTYWTCTESGRPRIEAPVLDALASLPHQKVIHSVGVPVANTSFDPEALALLRRMVERFGCEYFSEHLAFNFAALSGAGEVFTGFLLPPGSSAREAERIGRNARALSDAVGAPIALETAVNYLAPRDGELTDGDFVARTVEAAGAGILLDLHNIWANERNGRESVADFIASLPLDRVWEVHLADGIDLEGTWLDAHSGLPQRHLLDLLADLLPRLPNLRSVVFELLPQHTHTLDIDAARAFLEELRRLRPRASSRRPPLRAPAPRSRGPAALLATENQALARAILAPDPSIAPDLLGDPGVALYRRLMVDVRLSQLVTALPATTRAACTTHGPDAFEAWMRAFCASHPAAVFPAGDALGFARFLDQLDELAPVVRATAADERATIVASLS